MGRLAPPEGGCVWDISWASLCSTHHPPIVVFSGHLGQPSVGAWGWLQHGGHLPSLIGGAVELAVAPGSPMVCSLLGGAAAAAGYHGDREARAQGSPWPAKGNCSGSWRQTT